MAQVINTNVASLTAQRNLNKSQSSLNTSLQRLSSGLRINSAKDDAAGLAISQRMTSQIRGLDQAQRNANDGVSLAQTAEGSLSSAGDMLQRIRELAVQSANATNSASDREALQNEVSQLAQELDRLSTTTEFNGKKLLDGTFGTQQYQVGANANQTITASMSNFRTTQYGNNQVASTGANVGANLATGSAVAASNITVNGYLGSKSVAVNTGDSAKTIASSINNATSSTGVTATAQTNVQMTFSAAGAYNLTIAAENSTAENISFTLPTGGFANADGLSAAITAFNDKSSKTGVTASLNTAGTGIILTSATGTDIKVADTTTANAGTTTLQALKSDLTTSLGSARTLAADTTADTAYVTGEVTFDSQKSFSLVDSVSNVVGGTTAVSSALKSVSTLDVSTFAKSTDALKIVDAALTLINGQRAQMGALQSRFENTISNLQTSSENLSASRSRIQDTDFASETSNLTKSQILQQAGTAMLAQAKSLPQQVLSLLQ